MFGKNLIVDTQSFIWFAENNAKLPNSIRDTIENSQNRLFISIASLWEMVIKSSLGRLELKTSIIDILNDINNSDFSVLPIKPQHLITLHGLEHIHRDPFDRIIISQAISENMIVISYDDIFEKYPIILEK